MVSENRSIEGLYCLWNGREVSSHVKVYPSLTDGIGGERNISLAMICREKVGR